MITPVMDVATAKQRLLEFQQFVKEYMVEGEDYGLIPGVAKKVLLKPGADKLCELYGLADEYEVTQRVEDWDKGLFDYETKCILTSKVTQAFVSSGLGSCNSYETKYRWRDSKRLCPTCGKDSIIKGKAEYGGGWICFAKKGGCGGKFAESDQNIVGQTVGRTQNEDIADAKNTILKMSKKRSKIDATLSATRSSGLFTQDVEEWHIPLAPTRDYSNDAPETENPTVPTGSQTQASSGATRRKSTNGKGTAVRTVEASTPSMDAAANSDKHDTRRPQSFPGHAGQTWFDGKDVLCTVIKRVAGLTAQKIEELAKQNRNPWLTVTFTDKHHGMDTASCFPQHLWDSLQDSIGMECYLRITEKELPDGRKFLNIVDLLAVDGTPHIDGQPEGWKK